MQDDETLPVYPDPFQHGPDAEPDPNVLPPAMPVAPQAFTPPRRRLPRWLLPAAGLLAVAAIVGAVLIGVGAARAQNLGLASNLAATSTPTERPGKGPHGPGWGPGFGHGGLTVTNVSGQTITATGRNNQTVTITVTSSTKYYKPGKQTAALSDITKGTMIAVKGQRTGTTNITADTIMIVPPSAEGKVTSVGTNTFTVQDRSGQSKVVKTTSSTKFMIGHQTGSSADVKVGAEVGATGTQNADGSLTADVVEVRVPMVAGQITAINGNTITIKGFMRGSDVVQVSAATTYTDAMTKANLHLSDLKVGEYIMAQGTPGANNAFDATAIYVLPAGKMPGGKP